MVPIFLEAIGPEPGTTNPAQYLHLRAMDRFSGDANAFLADGIRVYADGGHTHSMERWVRFRFDPPFELVGGFRFWCPGLIVPDGWTFRYGTTSTYRRPVPSPSSIAVNVMPTSRPGAPNVGPSELMDGTQPRYSDWIVLQAGVGRDAPAGPMVAEPITYRLDWDEA